LTVAIVALLIAAALAYLLTLEAGVGFLIGAALSMTVGVIGMQVGVRANVRTAEAARAGADAALKIAFRAGAVTGLLVVGLALLGIAAFYLALAPVDTADSDGRQHALHALLGLALGSSLVSMFARVGGGIFTKAADLAAGVAGALEAAVPTNDPRNPAVIADNVGDNVGECAGMAADLFETYAVTLIATMLLGGLLLQEQAAGAVGYPLVLAGVSALACVVGTFFVRLEPGDPRLIGALSKGMMVSGVLAFVLFVPATWLLLPATFVVPGFESIVSRWGLLGAAGIGLALTGMILVITEYYTGSDYAPVKGLAKASASGAVANVTAGLSLSLRASGAPVLMICAAIWAAHEMAGLYGLAIAATSMLSMTGMIVAIDVLGPITDNAGGIAEMTEMDAPAREVTGRLDALGNTTKAVAKAYAIGSAALAALVLFADFDQTLAGVGEGLRFELDHPAVLIGLFLGALMPYLFGAMAMEAVGRVAAGVVEEVRRQFRELPGIIDGSQRPEYSHAVDLLTRSAIKEMIIPALLPVAVPIAVGFGMQWLMGGHAGALALGGLLIGTIMTGVLVAISMTAGGGAWDNAKKSIEAGHFGGPGSDAHRAAIIGDAVGDVYKDAAGPAVNPAIKTVNIVALLMVPFL
jgi:K(+)-stimulated pyrophosphate-energized sodium pump